MRGSPLPFPAWLLPAPQAHPNGKEMAKACACAPMNSTVYETNWVARQNRFVRGLATAAGVRVLPFYGLSADRVDLNIHTNCIRGWKHCACDWCAAGRKAPAGRPSPLPAGLSGVSMSGSDGETSSPLLRRSGAQRAMARRRELSCALCLLPRSTHSCFSPAFWRDVFAEWLPMLQQEAEGGGGGDGATPAAAGGGIKAAGSAGGGKGAEKQPPKKLPSAAAGDPPGDIDSGPMSQPTAGRRRGS